MSMFQSFEDEEEVVQAENEADNKRLDFNNDLFTSLAQPFAFPCVKEIGMTVKNVNLSE